MCLVTQTLKVHQMHVFSYSIPSRNVLRLRGIITVSSAPEKTRPVYIFVDVCAA